VQAQSVFLLVERRLLVPVLSIAQILHLLKGRDHIAGHAARLGLKGSQQSSIALQASVESMGRQILSCLLAKAPSLLDLLKDRRAVLAVQEYRAALAQSLAYERRAGGRVPEVKTAYKQAF